MISPWLVYFIVILDRLSSSLLDLSLTSLLVLIVCSLIYVLSDQVIEGKEVNHKNFKVTCKIILGTFFISFCAYIFIPKTNEAVAIYLIPKVANSVSQSQFMESMPDKIETIINNLLKEDKDVHADK